MPMEGSLHEIPIVGILESFYMGEHIQVGGRVTHRSTGTEAPVLGTLPHLALFLSSFGCSSVSFIISFNKLINASVSLSSVSHLAKLIEPKEEVVGISSL